MAVDKKKGEVMCPVTFVKNELIYDKDVNTIFMSPFDAKMIQDQFSGVALEKGIREPLFKKYKDKLLPSSFEDFCYDYCSLNNTSISYTIISYLKMNILDVIYATYCRFLDNSFDDNIKVNKFYITDNPKYHKANSSIKQYMAVNFTGYFENPDVRFFDVINSIIDKNLQKINSTINPYLFNADNMNNNYIIIKEQLTISIDCLLQSLFSEVITAFNTVFTNWVLGEVGMDSVGGYVLYNYFNYKAYEKEPVSYEDYYKIDKGTKYTLLTSLLRECFDREIFFLRDAFIQIASTASMMFMKTKPIMYGDLKDRNYKLNYSKQFAIDAEWEGTI